jgi:hypothetical protein
MASDWKYVNKVHRFLNRCKNQSDELIKATTGSSYSKAPIIYSSDETLDRYITRKLLGEKYNPGEENNKKESPDVFIDTYDFDERFPPISIRKVRLHSYVREARDDRRQLQEEVAYCKTFNTEQPEIKKPVEVSFTPKRPTAAEVYQNELNRLEHYTDSIQYTFTPINAAFYSTILFDVIYNRIAYYSMYKGVNCQIVMGNDQKNGLYFQYLIMYKGNAYINIHDFISKHFHPATFVPAMFTSLTTAFNQLCAQQGFDKAKTHIFFWLHPEKYNIECWLYNNNKAVRSLTQDELFTDSF